LTEGMSSMLVTIVGDREEKLLELLQSVSPQVSTVQSLGHLLTGKASAKIWWCSIRDSSPEFRLPLARCAGRTRVSA
jgi:hypothetical protein